MKHFLLIIPLFAFAFSHAQPGSTSRMQPNAASTQVRRWGSDSALILPRFCGFPATPRALDLWDYSGNVVWDTCGNRLGLWNGSTWLSFRDSTFIATFFNALFATKTTDNLAEGSTNLYYTNARARSAISATSPIAYNSGTGDLGLGTVPIANGGTGITSYSTGDIIYYNGTALAKLPIGTAAQTLHVVSGLPAWRDTADSGGGGGVTAMGAFGSSPNANGGTISGNTLILQPANRTNAGGLSISAQEIGGRKTFWDSVYFGPTGDGTHVSAFINYDQIYGKAGFGRVRPNSGINWFDFFNVNLTGSQNGFRWYGGGQISSSPSLWMSLTSANLTLGSANLSLSNQLNYVNQGDGYHDRIYISDLGAGSRVGISLLANNGGRRSMDFYQPTQADVNTGFRFYGGGTGTSSPSGGVWYFVNQHQVYWNSAYYTMNSTTGGLRIPMLTTAQRNAISTFRTNEKLSNTELDIDNDYNGTVWTVDDGTIFTQTADKDINTSVTETTLFGTGSGTRTIPANYLTTGNTIVIKLSGYMTTSGTPTLNIRFKLGTTTIASTGATTLVSVASDGYWEAEAILTARAAPSATSAIMGQAKFNYHSAPTIVNTISAMNTATVNAATNGGLAVDVTAQWGTSDAANKIVCTNAIVELKN